MLRHNVLLQLVSVATTNMDVEWDRGYLTASQTATRCGKVRGERLGTLREQAGRDGPHLPRATLGTSASPVGYPHSGDAAKRAAFKGNPKSLLRRRVEAGRSSRSGDVQMLGADQDAEPDIRCQLAGDRVRRREIPVDPGYVGVGFRRAE